VRRIRCLLGQGWRVATRWGQVFDALQAHHPHEPSWYLGSLGVDPAAQGRGVGAALLGRWLERVDRERSAAYLETDVLANVRFYGRAGFDLEGEGEVLGTPIWRMWRPALAGEISTASPPQ
jgi:GNAT superfamily N-acetyltransferase